MRSLKTVYVKQVERLHKQPKQRVTADKIRRSCSSADDNPQQLKTAVLINKLMAETEMFSQSRKRASEKERIICEAVML